MRVYVSVLSIEGAILEGENPLPIFRDRNHHREITVDKNFMQELKKNLGRETTDRFLPYRIQDRYTRNKKNIILKTIIVENDILKATFLPEYGGRLYALEDKRDGRELLYKNPIFQPANLAILNAWFSGGIEWNIGQLGHAFTTCSPVFSAKLVDDASNEFLRIYEYERCKNVFWNVDFHLPKGSDKLLVYTRIVNDNEKAVPMYWWTNIAARETRKTRVFSDADDVIYQDHKLMGFGFHNMPYLPSNPGYDSSYPMQFSYASEYFFQTSDKQKSPWEAVVYEDGRMFFERSTSMLRYRKMFCWGNHTGGRRWCDFLAKPGEGDYIEIQSGLAPTQLHGTDMPANTEWDFTQVFGSSSVDVGLAYQEDWNNSRDYIRKCIDSDLGAGDVYHIHNRLRKYACREINEMLNTGSGWGALERLRRNVMENRNIPKGYCFLSNSLKEPQYPWITLLQKGNLPDMDVNDVPVSWMIQDEWIEILENSLKHVYGHTWNVYMHYGVMLYEKGLEKEAIEAWKKSLSIKESAWVYRNLSVTMKNNGDTNSALSYLEKAYALSNGFPDKAFAEEYLSLLTECKEFEKAWSVYESLPERFALDERIQMIIGTAALELGNDEFMKELFSKEFAVLREGETLIVELWYEYNAKKLARERMMDVTEDIMREAKIKFPPPVNMDFRVIELI